MIDIEKFICSLIEKTSGLNTHVYHCDLLNALKAQGLEYKNGEIIKTQRRISAEAKEALYTTEVDSVDEKIRKELLEHCKNQAKPYIQTGNKCPQIQSWIDWLEKQGNEKKDFHEGYKKVAKSNWFKKSHEDKSCGMITNENEYKPKFKVGDWIVYECGEDSATLQIKNIIYGTYEFTDDSTLNVVDEDSLRLWSIKDANDGDVLCYETKNELRIFIYKNGHIHYHYCYDNGHLTTIDSFFVIQKHLLCYIHPATKEQRDLLFSKMKEAGYEWDAEKKELKKIHVIDEGKAEMDYCFTKMMAGEKVNPTWNVEDSSKVQRICKYLNEAKKYYADITEVRECVNWLKSLEDRVQPKPKEWSDEDDAMLDCVIEDIECIQGYTRNDDLIATYTNEIKWLQSIKQRLEGK